MISLTQTAVWVSMGNVEGMWIIHVWIDYGADLYYHI